MIKVYIGNTTTQNLRFCYSLREYKENFFVNIPSGGQEIIPHRDLSADQVDYLIEQLHRYGARPVKEISDRIPGFSGITYSVDRVISVDKIDQGHEAVKTEAAERSMREVENAVRRADLTENRRNDGRNPSSSSRIARDVEVEIEEKGDPMKPSKDPIKTRITVTPTARDKREVVR